MDADELKKRCVPIELLVMDVDGVLTDGVIALDDRGVEHKHFHVRDGFAISCWRKAGKRAAILSGRRARCVDLRAAELHIAPVLQGNIQKAGPFRQLLDDLRLQPHQVCFMGDDLPDLPVLRAAGLAACPADAVPEVRAAVHVVTAARGGHGSVREVIELILTHQGRWQNVVASYQLPSGTAPETASGKTVKKKTSLQ